MRQTTNQLTLQSYTLTITEALLAGQTLTATPGCTVTINGAAPTLPHTLVVGEVLAVTHTAGASLSGLTLLAAVTADAVAGSLPDPDSAQWSWSDTFARSFLGSDYTTDLSSNQAASISGGVLTLGQNVLIQYQQGQDAAGSREHARARLVAARWNSRDVAVQYDSSYSLVSGAFNNVAPQTGVRLVGANNALVWDGTFLYWSGAVIAQTASGLQPGTTYRTRLVVDQASGRIQVTRDNQGLIDVALPADWATGMGAQGLVELLAETSPTPSSAAVNSTRVAVKFDNLAVRSGSGAASQATGSTGTQVQLGSLWRFGQGAPDDALGGNGDIWLDTASGSVYQRVNGAYQATPGNLRGPQGTPGVNGVASVNGKSGIVTLTAGDVGAASSGDLAAKADLVNGKIPSAQLPALAVGERFVVASQAAMLALTAQIDDIAVRTDLNNQRFLLTGNAGTLADWFNLDAGSSSGGGVITVNGYGGNVVLGFADVGAAPVAAAVPAGGTTGQVLTKTGSGDYAVSWQTPAAAAGGTVAHDSTLTGDGTATSPLSVVGSTAAPSPDKTLVALGDSITYGDQVGGPANAWPAALASLRGWSVTNAGSNGSSLSTGGGTPMVGRWSSAVPTGYAGHVTLLGGTNDYTNNLPLGAPGNTDTSTVYGALLTIARGIVARSTRVVLHLMTPTWRGDTGHTEGTRNTATVPYTMEQVRQAVRDVAAQVGRESPGQVQLIELGRNLADYLSNGNTFIGSDFLHPNAAGHTLISQHLALQLSGASGTPATFTETLLYDGVFASLTAGPLNGQDGWTVVNGSYTVSSSGLAVNAAFNSYPRGALKALPSGTVRARMLVASGGPMLRFHLQDGSDTTYATWINLSGSTPYLDWGQLTGPSLQQGATWFGTSGVTPAAPAYPFWVEIEQASGEMHLRAWADGASRPTNAQYTHSIDGSSATLLSGGSVGLAHVGAPGTVKRVQLS